MKSAVTISLVKEAQGGPFIFWHGLAEACRRAAELGFDAIEIFPPAADALDVGQLKELLARHKLRVAAVGTGAGWVVRKWSLSDPDPAIRSRAVAFIKAIIDLASIFDAPAIIGSMQGRTGTDVSRAQALSWLAESLKELGAHAAGQGQTVLVEPLNRYETTLLNRLGDTAKFLETLPAQNIKVLADLFHMNIEETSIPDAFLASGAHLGHVHFADSNRWAIGLGHIEVKPIISALRQVGYQGYLSAEVLPLPDSDTAARQTIESFRRLLSHA